MSRDMAPSGYHEYFEYRRYPLRVPPLDNGVDPVRHPVAIVGGGPIGLALALGLARHGVRSVVIEADDAVSYGSRAACISRRSLEILDRLGVAEDVLGEALPWTAGTSYYRDVPVYRLQMPMDENQRFAPMVNLEQCICEQLLADRAEALRSLVEIRWQTKLAGLQRRDDGVELELETPQTPYRLRADWVVACDGARSAVRQAMGLRFSGSTYDGTYIIVDIHLKSDYPTERRAWFDPPTNPGSTILVHKQPRDIWRVDYQLRDDEDPEEAVKPENVLPRVRSHLEWIGERDDWTPVWISAYRANCLTLDSYRHGRVLFAGDAAHLVPIFGVRGMNSGIDDTHNLAWKLAWVVQGRSPAALLDSYSSERVFAARENIRHASKSTEFMAPPSSAFKLMREAALGLATCRPVLRHAHQPAAIERDHVRRLAPQRRRFGTAAVRADARRGARRVSGRNGDGVAASDRAARPRLHRALPGRRRPAGGARRTARSAALGRVDRAAKDRGGRRVGRDRPTLSALRRRARGLLPRTSRRPRRRALARGAARLDRGGGPARTAIGLIRCSPTRNWTTSTPGRATR